MNKHYNTVYYDLCIRVRVPILQAQCDENGLIIWMHLLQNLTIRNPRHGLVIVVALI
jgi:hypothetical protein